MEFHEVANIFPMMSDEEFQALVVDIKVNGLREPIWTYRDKIIDGRNRYRACLAADVLPVVREWGGKDEADLLPFILSLNLQRRHLSSGQKAILAVEVEKYLAVEAERRMLAGKKADPVQKVAQGKSADQAARIVGTNRQYVLDAKKVMETAPALGEAVRRGDLSIPDATSILRMKGTARQAMIACAGDVKNGMWPAGKMKLAIKEAAEKTAAEERQKREAERASPEYQERVQKAEKERRASLEEWNRRWKEREAAHATRVQAQLNVPDKEDIRATLYAAAKEADMRLTRALQSYLTFLMHFGTLMEDVMLEEDTYNETPHSRAHPPRDWNLYTENGRSQWLKNFVDKEYGGSYENLLAQVAGNKQLYHATDIPYINFINLQRWIDDPSAQQEESS